MLPISSPSCLTPQPGVLPPRRRGAPQGNKNALGHGAPRGNKNGLGHGAPRGNRNALKFGVYTCEFTRPMIPPPGVSLMETLELEKGRLRLFIKEELASVNPASLDYGSSLALLRAVTIAVGRIRRIHRHILRIQASHAFESHLGRSLAGELALFPEAVQGFVLLPSPFFRLPPSVFQNNCLLVPLFSPEQMDSGFPPSSRWRSLYLSRQMLVRNSKSPPQMGQTRVFFLKLGQKMGQLCFATDSHSAMSARLHV